MKAHHRYLVEFHPPVSEEALRLFAERLDRALRSRNADYGEYRCDNRIQPPQLLAAPPGTFARWMESRGKLGGQNKVPRIILDKSLWESLLGSA